ncbi:HAD-like domain-containing protein [Mycena haematopus]|nr:HAD-like domain-containing protein [Mycena haematopus]
MGSKNPLGDRVTTVHVSNLHCGSCVITIQDALASLSPPPLSVDVSVVLQTVTVHHLQALSPDDIQATILDAGFDVDLPQPDPGTSKRHETHLQQCILCQKERANDAPEPAPAVPLSRFRLVISVGGMSCASCTNTITRTLSEIEGISDVVVSLLTSSATAVIDRKELAEVASEAIEDCGFEAQIMSAEPITATALTESRLTSRTISLRVGGMFCKHCPMKAMAALENLGPRVVVTTPLISHTDPVVTLSYEPDPPSFTIRTIIAALESANSPPFNVTIYRPPSLEDRAKAMHAREQRRLLFRLLFTVVVAIPTFVIGIVFMSLVKDGNSTKEYFMTPMWTGNTSRSTWALFFLALPVMFYSAGLFHRRSIKEIVALWKRGSRTPILQRFIRFGSMNLLPRQIHGDTSTYFDSVVFLTMFLLAGRYLEAYSKAQTSQAITALAGLRPVEAQLVVPASRGDAVPEKSTNYDPEKAESETDLAGSLGAYVYHPVRCNTGSTPPADGTIVGPSEKSTFTFDESMLTGESMPVVKQLGDKVFLGSINRGQSVHIRVDTIGGGTMLDNIVAVVREGSTRRAPIERVADVITSYFVPGALPPDYLDMEIGGWTVWSLEFAIAVFVVACPCEAFQEMERVDVVVFDKTGTLTVGEEPRVSDIDFAPESPLKQEILLGIAAELESATSHPLAIAIRQYCASNGAIEQSGSSFSETAGLGVQAKFEAGLAIIGSQAFMEKHGIVIDESTAQLVQTWKLEAKSVVFLAVSDVADSDHFSGIAVVFAVSDPIRSEAPSVISWFAKQGVSTWMISGDNITTASAVAKMVGIPASNVIAGVLPHEKGEKIQMLQARGSKRPRSFLRSFGRQPKAIPRSIVTMVGDGINDAVALTVADVGIAIGSGSDVAISSASFILLSSDLRALITLCDLSRSIMKRVRLNFMWAIMYNLAALPIAAGAIYPAGHIRLDPVWASLAMALSSVSVICSSLALKLYRVPKLQQLA